MLPLHQDKIRKTEELFPLLDRVEEPWDTNSNPRSANLDKFEVDELGNSDYRAFVEGDIPSQMLF